VSLIIVTAFAPVACAPLLTASPPAGTIEPPPAQSVLPRGATLDDIAAQAVFANPELRALRAQEGVADAQVFAAGLLPDPSITLGADFPLDGIGAVTGLTASAGTDLMSWVRRPYNRAAAEQAREQIRRDIAWSEWQTAEQARLLAIRIAGLRTMRAMTRQLRVLAEDRLSAALGAAGRGDLPGSELETYRLAAADAIDRDQSVESRLSEAEHGLNQALGRAPAAPLDLAVAQPETVNLPQPADLYHRAIAERADLQALRAGLAEQDDVLAASLLARYPVPTIDINGARDTGNLRTLGPSVSFTLPVWNRGRGDIAVARATRAQMQAEYAARLASLNADIHAASAALGIALRQRDGIRRTLAPLSDQAEAADAAAERGDLSRSTAHATRMTLLDRRIAEAELTLSVNEYRQALEVLTGAPLEARHD